LPVEISAVKPPVLRSVSHSPIEVQVKKRTEGRGGKWSFLQLTEHNDTIRLLYSISDILSGGTTFIKSNKERMGFIQHSLA
jgi:hypothetical protein